MEITHSGMYPVADAPELAPDRREVLEKIARYEQEKKFDVDVENDPPTKPLRYEKVDYTGDKLFSKMKTALANKLGYAYFDKLIKKGDVVLEGVEGTEHLEALRNGAVVTCNHFSIFDHFLAYRALMDALPLGRLYKIVREGNYTSSTGLFGFLFRNCNTLPLSADPRGSMALMKAVRTLLDRGESVLIYPEQAMWWNYRKPRPFKSGGFIMAAKAGVPVLPVYITMRDADTTGKDGYPLQKHTVRILPPVFPDASAAPKACAEEMRRKTFARYVETYERVYGKEYDL